ncbi:MAG: threonine-phosphate decarboxylase CobD [Pseudomonadota bacterium]
MSEDLLHGGALDHMRARFPDAPEPWLDLSTGINPWPYPNTDISLAALARLPTEADYRACRSAMATAIKAPEDTIVLAPGSELLIRLLPEIIDARRIAILSPTYGDHYPVWHNIGANILQTRSPLDAVETSEVIIICNPNNPDGHVFPIDILNQARERLAARGGWLIVDEAYGDLYAEQSLAAQGGSDGLLILRSFGKFFGLAGLRLGGLIAPAGLCDVVKHHLGTWPVSGAALEIGARAYADAAWQTNTRKKLADASVRLKTVIETSSLKLIGGTHLFQYVETDCAHALWEHLARHGIYVRRFDWSDKHLRIGLTANAEEEARLAAALNLLK